MSQSPEALTTVDRLAHHQAVEWAVEQGEEDLRFAITMEIRTSVERLLNQTAARGDGETVYLVSRVADYSPGRSPQDDEIYLLMLEHYPVYDGKAEDGLNPAEQAGFEDDPERPDFDHLVLSGGIFRGGEQRLVEINFTSADVAEQLVDRMGNVDLLELAKLRVALRRGHVRVVEESFYQGLVQRGQYGALDPDMLAR